MLFLLPKGGTEPFGSIKTPITPVRGIQIQNRFGLFLIYIGPTKNAMYVKLAVSPFKPCLKLDYYGGILKFGACGVLAPDPDNPAGLTLTSYPKYILERLGRKKKKKILLIYVLIMKGAWTSRLKYLGLNGKRFFSLQHDFTKTKTDGYDFL